MLKKIVPLFFCLALFTNVKAQLSTAADGILGNMKNIIGNILGDSSMTKTCKKPIKVFSDSIAAINSASAQTKTKRLISCSQKFQSSYKAEAKSCKNKQADSLNSLTTQLIVELKKPSPDSIGVTIIFVDSSKNGISNWKLQFDSLAKPVNSFIITDSTGHFQVSLLPNTNSVFKIKNLVDTNLQIAQDSNHLAVGLIKLKSLGNSQDNNGTDNVVSELDTLLLTKNILLIIVSILFFSTIGAIIYSVRMYRRFNRLPNNISDESANTKTNEPMMPEVEDKLNEAQTDVDVLQETVTLNTDETMLSAAAVLKPEAYFICEMMMTAGPRKKPIGDSHGDVDLGEDVCGFMSNSNSVFLWLLDGTSDDDSWREPDTKREYFSSRLLAQSIGIEVRKAFAAGLTDSLGKTVEQAIAQVKQNWLSIINDLPDAVKLVLKSRIENKSFPQCSTTVLIGHLKKDGDFDAYRAGDSKLAIFSTSAQNKIYQIETALADKNPNGVDRLFFRLQLDANQKFAIASNEARYEVTGNKDVSMVISFSDGIGLDTEMLLKDEYENNPEKIKKEIIYQLQGTGDDKSICFIERKEGIVNK